MCVLFGGVLLGTLLLTVAFLLPVKEEYVAESYRILEEEGWYPAVPVLSKSMDTHFHSLFPGVLDNGTDALMIETAAEPDSKNPLDSAMSMGGYSYYWHGYVAILRPLLLLFHYGDIRILNHILQLLLLLAVGGMIWKRKRKFRYVVVLFFSYVLMMPMAMGMSLQFSWVFYIAMTGILLLLRHQRREKDSQYYPLFLALGMATSYLDLLTYPLITWGIPLLWWLAVSPGETGQLYRLKRILFTGIHWIVGYAAMWGMKWLLGSLVLGENIFESALQEVFFRAGFQERLTFGDRLEAVYINWKHYEYKIYACILIAWLLYGVIRSIYCCWGSMRNACSYLLIGSSSVVWYLVLANHTAGHHFFTYRIFSVSILAFLLLVTECTGGKRKKFSPPIALGWLGIAVVSLGMAFLAREEMSVTNGWMEHSRVELSGEHFFETDFTPTFSGINSFGLCLESDGTEGEILLVLEQEGSVLYQEKISWENWMESSLQMIPVEWKLRAGRTYRLRLALQHSAQPVYVLVSEQSQGGLAEYQGLTVGEKTMPGQMLTKISYRSYPFSRKTIVFLAFTWMGIWGSVAAGVKKILV